jgi:hypothetical protein
VGYLDKVTRGPVAGPVRMVVYGAAGVGKSSFAAQAPSPLFLDFENRTAHLDVARIRPQSWDETLATLRELHASPGDYKTVVFDTLDHMETLIHAAVCARNGWATIEDPDYGKGYVPALLEWGRFLNAAEALQAKGLHVLMLAHAMTGTVKNPAGDDYNIIKLKLKGGAKTDASLLVTERAELIGYAHFEDLVKKAKSDPRAKALTTGDRLLTFKHHPSYQNKCGVPLGAVEMKLEWAAFEAALARR